MNTNDTQMPIDEARWQAQEKARRSDADADAEDLRIARALRHAPAVDLPFDFAAQVAALARRQAAVDSRMEQRLLRGLGIDTGIDFDKAVATGQWISGILQRKAHSRAGNAVTAKLAA